MKNAWSYRETLPLLLVVVPFAMLKGYGVHATPGDEGIYFYLARRIAEAGLVPYRDFFFAHPPVHLLPAAIAFFFLGPSLVVAKAIPALAALGTVVLLYVGTLRSLGRLGAFVAALALATAYDYLRTSSHFMGVNVALLLVTAAALCAWSGRSRRAGVFAALGVQSAVYGAPTALGALMVAVWRQRREGADALLAFVGVVGAVHLLFVAVAGGAFFEQVYGYHLAKPGVLFAGLRMAGRVLVDNPWLTAGWLLGGVCGVDEWWTRRRAGFSWKQSWQSPWAVGVLGFLLGLGNLLVLGALQRAFPFYFLMAMPGMAVSGGYAGYRMGLWVSAPFSHLPRTSGLPRLAVGLALLFLVPDGAAMARSRWYPKTVPRSVHHYTWQDSSLLPDAVNDGVRANLWQDRRQPGVFYGGVSRYLWHESRRKDDVMAVVRFLDAFTSPHQTVFGDSLVAPYAAFLAGRRISGEQADSNAARFRSGTTDPRALIAGINGDKEFAFLITRPRQGFVRVSEFGQWIASGFEVDPRWRPRGATRALLLRRRR